VKYLTDDAVPGNARAHELPYDAAMRALIIHQNFPGQFVHVARALADDPQNEVVAIGDARTLSKRPAVHPKIRVLAYEAPEGGSASTHPYLRDHEGHVRRGQVVLRTLMQLKASGWVPDLILAHPGWGEVSRCAGAAVLRVFLRLARRGCELRPRVSRHAG
jgi:hypothetical protein